MAANAEQLEDFVQRWLEVNREAERNGDWTPLASSTPTTRPTAGISAPRERHVRRQGRDPRDRPRPGDGGLRGWTYPYQQVLIDDRIGEVVGFWKQVALVRRRRRPARFLRHRRQLVSGSTTTDSSNGNATSSTSYPEAVSGADEGRVMSSGMQQRIQRSLAGATPRYYPLGQAPVPIW